MVLALILGACGMTHELLPPKTLPSPARQKSVTFQWGRGEGSATSKLFRIAAKGKMPIAEQPLPEKLKPFFYFPMDVNRVSPDLLQTVPGIGEKLAGRIILRRQRSGGFRKLTELGRIEGIGTRKLAELGKYLTCDSSPILLK